jgi:hypothetical protein
MNISSHILARGTAIRQQAEHLKAQLLNKPEGWVQAEPSSRYEDKRGVTEHRRLQAPDGDTISGFVTTSKDGIERFNVSYVDYENEKFVKSESYEMRSVAPPAWTAPAGEALMNLGIGLAHVPGGFLLGFPMLALGRALTFSESKPDLKIYRQRQENGYEYAVFDHQGQYLGNELRPSQHLQFN